MTAPDRSLAEDPATAATAVGVADRARHVDELCAAAMEGRLAVRALAAWALPFEFSEAELQVLWCLRSAGEEGLDQTTLARRLAYSAAQVSATVERARGRGWICHLAASADRRRRLWRLSSTGRTLLEAMLAVPGREAA